MVDYYQDGVPDLQAQIDAIFSGLDEHSRIELNKLRTRQNARLADQIISDLEAKARGEHRGWFDVASAIKSGEEPPSPPRVFPFADWLGHYLLYEGRYNALFGDFGQGKSLLLSAIQAHYINDHQHVAHLEYDNNTADQVIWRVVNAGASPELVAEYFHVLVGETAIPEFDFKPAFVSLDSVNAAISMYDGMDPNSSGKGVDTVISNLLNPFIQRGATALSLDHINKTDKDRPSNNLRKMQAVQGVMLKIERVGEAGQIGDMWMSKLTVTKDNPGWASQPVGKTLGFVVFDGTAGDGSFKVDLYHRQVPLSVASDAYNVKDDLSDLILEIVDDIKHGGITKAGVLRELYAQGHEDFHERTVQRALQELYELGEIGGEQRGTHRTAPWHYYSLNSIEDNEQ